MVRLCPRWAGRLGVRRLHGVDLHAELVVGAERGQRVLCDAHGNISNIGLPSLLRLIGLLGLLIPAPRDELDERVSRLASLSCTSSVAVCSATYSKRCLSL